MLYISQKLLMLPSVENVDVKFRKRVRRTDFLIRNRSMFQTTRFGREVPWCPFVRHTRLHRTTSHERDTHRVFTFIMWRGAAYVHVRERRRHRKTHGTHMHQCTSRTYTIARHTHQRLCPTPSGACRTPSVLQMGFAVS